MTPHGIWVYNPEFRVPLGDVPMQDEEWQQEEATYKILSIWPSFARYGKPKVFKSIHVFGLSCIDQLGILSVTI